MLTWDIRLFSGQQRMLDITLVLGGVVVVLLLVHWKQMKSSSRNAPWAPGWLPIIGNTITIISNIKHIFDYVCMKQ